MAYKAGLVVEKTIQEWFDPHREDHLLAYFHLCHMGSWPPGFLSSEVCCRGDWMNDITAVVHERGTPRPLREQQARLDHLKQLATSFLNPGLLVEPLWMYFTVRGPVGPRILLEGDDEAVLSQMAVARCC